MGKVIFEIAEYQPEKQILKNSKRDLLIRLGYKSCHISCVILGKMLNYFLSQFPHLQVKNGNNGTLPGVC